MCSEEWNTTEMFCTLKETMSGILKRMMLCEIEEDLIDNFDFLFNN